MGVQVLRSGNRLTTLDLRTCGEKDNVFFVDISFQPDRGSGHFSPPILAETAAQWPASGDWRKNS
jgi:hypothetical protein